ncbi:hypothetical protein Si074_01203 [Streptococcus infantarius subsp. infantarius]|nr:hypothetical protein [Streptococcus infantarius subsp. infantarius]
MTSRRMRSVSLFVRSAVVAVIWIDGVSFGDIGSVV